MIKINSLSYILKTEFKIPGADALNQKIQNNPMSSNDQHIFINAHGSLKFFLES